MTKKLKNYETIKKDYTIMLDIVANYQTKSLF